MKILVTIFLSLLCCGCNAGSKDSDPSKPLLLGIVGYNYTQNYIDDFSVDGQAGGNLRVVDADNGGGSVACCVKYWPSQRSHTVQIRWQSNACFYHSKSSTSKEIFDNIYSFYSEKEIAIELSDISPSPKYIEVYFYPNESIKVALTEHSSQPRIPKVKPAAQKKYPRCPDDKKPEE